MSINAKSHNEAIMLNDIFSRLEWYGWHADATADPATVVVQYKSPKHGTWRATSRLTPPALRWGVCATASRSTKARRCSKSLIFPSCPPSGGRLSTQTKHNTDMAKVSTRTSGLKNKAEFEAAANECAALEVELRMATAAQDKELQAVRDRHEATIVSLTNRRDALLNQCALYAGMHQDEVLTPGQRSGSTTAARFGFRLGQPTLVLLSSKHKWKTVVAAIKERGQDFIDRFLTIPDPKPNKDQLKAQLNAAELAELGCRVEQTDAFFIEAKDDTMAELTD